jgi:hypothetical protein
MTRASSPSQEVPAIAEAVGGVVGLGGGGGVARASDLLAACAVGPGLAWLAFWGGAVVPVVADTLGHVPRADGRGGVVWARAHMAEGAVLVDLAGGADPAAEVGLSAVGTEGQVVAHLRPSQ